MSQVITSAKDAETRQPTAFGGQYQPMPPPGTLDGVVPGLEYLASVDQLICKQEVHVLEVLTQWECKNKYRLLNSMEQQVYFAMEESTVFQRLCCGANRGFKIHIVDNYQQEVLTLERPFKCCSGCCWCADGCCMYPIYVKDRSGRQLGVIRMMGSCCRLHFGIFDNDEQLLYELWAPWCPCQCVCGCTADIVFPIRSARDNSEVANIRKIWAGVFREWISNADTLAVSFPLNLDVTHKALMVATMFLIDFSIFEQQKKNNNN